MTEDLTQTYLDFAQIHTEPLISFDHLTRIHRRFRETFKDARTRRRSCMFLAALVHTITESLDAEDPHRYPQFSDDSDPDSEVLTGEGLPYGSAEAVADVVSVGDDPAEQLERMALLHLENGFAQFTMHSVAHVEMGAEWFENLISSEPEEIDHGSLEPALSALRFAIHRRRFFEGHHDPGLLVIFYHFAYMLGSGQFDQSSVADLIKDVAVPEGTYRSFTQ